MANPQPVVLVRMGEVPILGDYPSLEAAVKDAGSYGIGDYYAMRILRPVVVKAPEPQDLKVEVGAGFIKRKPKAPKATPPEGGSGSE